MFRTIGSPKTVRDPGGDRPDGGKLDVLIVSQPASAGVAVCVRQLAQAAMAEGHEVTVACPDLDHGPLAGWVRAMGAHHRRLNMTRRPAVRDLADLWAIRKLCRGKDVVHLHSSKAGALGRVAAFSLGRSRPAVVFTPHYWSWFVGGPQARVYRLVEKALGWLNDAIVAVSEQEAREGRRVLGRAGEKVTVIGNGIDLEEFSPHGPIAARDTERPLVVQVGRICRQKGQDIAIRALTHLEDQDALLRVVGGESEPGERLRMENLADSLGVGHRIEWRGEVTDVAAELRAADVVISPSRWEGMSLVFLEAMACGAPTVVTDVAGSDVVDGAGVVVPREDPEALAAEVDRLLADVDHRERLGSLALERSAGHDVDETLHRNLELWKTTSAQRRPRRALS